MDSVEGVVAANLANRAAGESLLQALPWQQKLTARLRSVTLLVVIAASFWVRGLLMNTLISTLYPMHHIGVDWQCHLLLLLPLLHSPSLQPTLWTVAAICAAYHAWKAAQGFLQSQSRSNAHRQRTSCHQQQHPVDVAPDCQAEPNQNPIKRGTAIVTGEHGVLSRRSVKAPGRWFVSQCSVPTPRWGPKSSARPNFEL